MSTTVRLRRSPVAPGSRHLEVPLDAATRLAMGLRAPSFAAAAVGSSVVGHVLAGGALPGLTVTGLLLATVALAFGALARRELSAVRLLVTLVAAESVLHVVLTVAAAPSGAAVPSGAALGPGGHLAHLAGAPAMLLAHLVVAAAATALLSRAECTAWRLARSLVPRLPRPVLLPAAPVRRVRPVEVVTPALPRCLVALRVAPLRGPPLPA